MDTVEKKNKIDKRENSDSSVPYFKYIYVLFYMANFSSVFIGVKSRGTSTPTF